MYFIMLLLPVINLKTLALDYQYDVETLFYTNAMRDRDSLLSPWKQTILARKKAVRCNMVRSGSYNKFWMYTQHIFPKWRQSDRMFWLAISSQSYYNSPR